MVIRDAVTEVKALREQAGGDIIIFGGNTLCLRLLEAGLLDEPQVMVNPVVVGAGSASLAGLKKEELVLTESKTFESGEVLLTNRPGHG